MQICFFMNSIKNSSSKRSTVLLVTLWVMLIYVWNYDVAYPYSHSQHVDDELFGEQTDVMVIRNSRIAGGNITHSNCSLCKFYNVSGFAEDLGYKCVRTSARPRTRVCIYDQWTDMFISHDLQYTGAWEPQVMRDFQEALGRNRHAGVIDLGANIGFYTMLAAKMGHTVIAVEPYLESIYRIHRALYLEKLGDKVFLLENGISNNREKAALRISGDNQGDHRLRLDVGPCHQGACPITVDTIVMDDLVPVIGNNFSSAIIKMDVQGFEHRAFDKAAELFDKIKIQYIFMEWSLMKEFYVTANYSSFDKRLVLKMIDFLFQRDFRPYALTFDGGQPLDPHVWDKWPFDVIWIRLPDEIEKRTIVSNHFRNWPT